MGGGGDAEVVRPEVLVDSDEGAANELRKPYKLNDPQKPSREEVETHEMHHLPHRSCCEVCARRQELEGMAGASVRVDE